jgi:hypothetical protein
VIYYNYDIKITIQRIQNEKKQLGKEVTIARSKIEKEKQQKLALNHRLNVVWDGIQTWPSPQTVSDTTVAMRTGTPESVKAIKPSKDLTISSSVVDAREKALKVSGTVTKPDEPVWIAVHPTGSENFFVSPAKVNTDGSWKAFFDLRKLPEVTPGHLIKVMAVADPLYDMTNYGELTKWPDAKKRSEIVSTTVK